MAREEKRAFLARELGELTRFHGERCPEYGRLLAALGTQPGQTDDFESLPFLPRAPFQGVFPEKRARTKRWPTL